MKIKRMRKVLEFLDGFSVVILSTRRPGHYAIMLREDTGVSIAWVARFFPGICADVENIGGVSQVLFY